MGVVTVGEDKEYTEGTKCPATVCNVVGGVRDELEVEAHREVVDDAGVVVVGKDREEFESFSTLSELYSSGNKHEAEEYLLSLDLRAVELAEEFIEANGVEEVEEEMFIPSDACREDML